MGVTLHCPGSGGSQASGCYQLPLIGHLLLCMVAPCTWDVLGFELVFGECKIWGVPLSMCTWA